MIKKTLYFLPLFFVMASMSPTNSFAFDMNHTQWTNVLEKHLDGNQVTYAALQKNSHELYSYLASVSSVKKSTYDSWNDNDRIAFWLNAYNAAMFRIVIENYPIKRSFGVKGLAYPTNSVQQISSVWDREAIQIFGEDYSLNRIEHKVLRKDFAEPRIHFALVCASIGCPDLRKEAYVGSRLDEQLEDQTISFLNDDSKNRFDASTKVLHLSHIFKWFGEDFGIEGGVPSFVKKYIKTTDGIQIPTNPRIHWLNYDWSLNEKK